MIFYFYNLSAATKWLSSSYVFLYGITSSVWPEGSETRAKIHKEEELNWIEWRIFTQMSKDGMGFEVSFWATSEGTKQKMHSEVAVTLTCGESWSKSL